MRIINLTLIDHMNNYQPANYKNFYFLPNRAKMSAVIRDLDWSLNSLQQPDKWPSGLRTTLGILMTSEIPMMLYWGQENIQFFNDAFFCNFHEDSNAKSTIGNSGSENPETWNIFGPLVKEIMQSREVNDAEDKQSYFKNQTKFRNKFYSCNYSPIYGDTENADGVLIICSEISETVWRLQTLLENVPFPIGVYEGPEMRITLANQSIIDVWDKGSDIVGKTYFDVLPELADQEIYPKLLNVFHAGIPFHAYNQPVDLMFQNELQTFYFNYSFTPLFDEQGKVYGVMNTAADVTALNLAKLKVEQSHTNFVNLILQSPVSMCLLMGPLHTVEVANDSIIDLWGKAKEEVMDKPIFEGLPDAREQGLESLLDSVYRTGEASISNERPVKLIRYGKPEIVYLNFIYSPYKDGAGEVLGVIAIANDVTEQVLARQRVEELVKLRTVQLVAANEDLARSNSELAQFAYIASHDLQEPLRKISIFTQLLEGKIGQTIDQKSQEQLKKIGQSAGRMQALVKDVLGYAQLNKQVSEFLPVNLNEVLDGILSDFELLIEQKQAVISFSELPFIPGQALQLTQLFSNLIGNALKFHHEGSSPHISIQTFQADRNELERLELFDDQEYIKITVSDNGIGFRPEEADKIFGIFERLHNKSEFEGTGIGLSICKKIVYNHQGVITAEGSSENGANFNIYLPLTINDKATGSISKFLY